MRIVSQKPTAHTAPAEHDGSPRPKDPSPSHLVPSLIPNARLPTPPHLSARRREDSLLQANDGRPKLNGCTAFHGRHSRYDRTIGIRRRGPHRPRYMLHSTLAAPSARHPTLMCDSPEATVGSADTTDRDRSVASVSYHQKRSRLPSQVHLHGRLPSPLGATARGLRHPRILIPTSPFQQMPPSTAVPGDPPLLFQRGHGRTKLDEVLSADGRHFRHDRIIGIRGRLPGRRHICLSQRPPQFHHMHYPDEGPTGVNRRVGPNEGSQVKAMAQAVDTRPELPRRHGPDAGGPQGLVIE